MREGKIMRKAGLLVITAILAVAAAGCHDPEPAPEQQKFTVLTTGLIAKYGIKPDEMMKLQYYVEGRLVLQRRLAEGERSVAHGKIEIRNGVQVNEVVVEAFTPGVALAREKDNVGLDIGFDPASQATLPFGPGPAGDYVLGSDPNGRVAYDGQPYTIMTRGNRLLVDLNAVSRVVQTRKTLPGRTIDGN